MPITTAPQIVVALDWCLGIIIIFQTSINGQVSISINVISVTAFVQGVFD